MNGETARKLAAIWQHSGDALVLADVETQKILDANPLAEVLFGYSCERFRTLNVLDLHPLDRQQEVIRIFIEGTANPGKYVDLEIQRSDGSRLPVEIHMSTFVGQGGRLIGIRAFRDISERVRAERGVRLLNWALTAVNRAAFAIATAETETDMMRLLCEGLTSDIFVLSWIGLVEDNPERSVLFAAKAGPSLGYLNGLEISWGDKPSGRGPTGCAIREARTQINNDALSNPSFAPWADRAFKNNILSSMATPLIRNHEAVGALTVYSNQVGAFTPDVVRLIDDLGKELVVGLDAKRHMSAYQIEAKRYLEEKLRYKGVLEQTIAALSTTIAKRDPYTAEHQRRVADYAVSVAIKLGWDLVRSESVYLAGLVHDIGKINVPSEILNKPGKLLGIEFELVKLHPMTGYEILKEIDFPWKLAEITKQHHERIDGSGYPDHLTGSNILPEAQVVAVADVFEAMLSHRPYRPALGRDIALAELRRLRNGLLDPEIVDAAIEVFAQEGAPLKTT